MDSLPPDLLIHILSRFPAKFLLQSTLVCKFWCNTILYDQDFASSQLNQYSQKNPCFLYMLGEKGGLSSLYVSSPDEDYDAAKYVDLRKVIIVSNNDTDLRGSKDQRELIGSCNGLVCFYNKDLKMIEVCNPTRNQTLCIYPPHLTQPSPADERSRYGFGYDSISKEYKIVCMLFEMSKCQVLSLGTKRSDWVDIPFDNDLIARLSEDDCSHSKRLTYFFNEFIERRTLTFHNRSFWWIHGKELFSFHIDHNNFQIIRLSPENLRRSSNSLMLLVHRENLCCAKVSVVGTGTIKWSIDLFILETRDNGHVWRMESSPLTFISPGHSLQIVDFKNQLLLHQVIGSRYLLWTYNLHTRKRKEVRKLVIDNLYGRREIVSENLVDGANFYNWASNTHVENLISLQTFVHQGVSCKLYMNRSL